MAAVTICCDFGAQERLLGEISRNVIRYTDDTTVMAESEEELKSLLMKVKEESEKAVLKFNIQKTKIMASSPITSWEIDGETERLLLNYDTGILGSRRRIQSGAKEEA